MNLTISAEKGWITVTATGDFSLEEAQQHFVQMLDALAEEKGAKVLFDGRNIKGNPDLIHRFLYGESAARAVARYTGDRRIPRESKFAYILQEPVLDRQRFGETVAVNRGMCVKAFDNMEDGVAWLSQDSKPKRGICA